MTNFLQTVEHGSVENIRNTFPEIMCKSNRYKICFFPDAIASWNNFNKHFDDVPYFDILKKHISTFFSSYDQ